MKSFAENVKPSLLSDLGFELNNLKTQAIPISTKVALAMKSTGVCFYCSHLNYTG